MQSHILVDTVLQRLRDPQGLGHDRATMRQLLGGIQRILNLRIKTVLSTVTLNTDPYRVFYPVGALLPDALDIVAVHSDGVDLEFVDWHTFWPFSRGWHRVSGDRFKAYAKVGRDLLIVWPSKPYASTVEVVQILRTADLEDATEMELPDETHPLMLDLLEVTGSVLGRNFGPIKPLLDSLAARIKAVV